MLGTFDRAGARASAPSESSDETARGVSLLSWLSRLRWLVPANFQEKMAGLVEKVA